METLIKKHGKRRFSLIGETILPVYARELSAAILKKGWKIKWSPHFMKIDNGFNRNTLLLMKKSGCDFRRVFLGIDVISDSAMKYANKGYFKKDIIRFLENAEKAGIEIGTIGLIYDFPGTRFNELMEGLDILERYSNVFINVRVSKFLLMKNSEMGRHPEKYGLTIIEDAENKRNPLTRTFRFVNKNPLTDDEMKAANKRIYHIQNTCRIFRFYPKIKRREFNFVKVYKPLKWQLFVKIPKQHEIIRKNIVIHNSSVPITDALIESQFFLKNTELGKWYSVEDLASFMQSRNDREEFVNLQKTFRLVRELLVIGYFEDVELEKNTLYIRLKRRFRNLTGS